MNDLSLLKHIKSATIAIALIRKNTREEHEALQIVGSGFLVSEDGYFITAHHVVDSCERLRSAYQAADQTLRVAVLRVDSTSDSVVLSMSDVVGGISLLDTSSENYVGPNNLDVFIGRINTKSKCPYLEIKADSDKVEILDEVIMSGYPGGHKTLDMYGELYSPRFNPIIQIGRISGFIPTDDHPNPVGVQTDIIGTAGSSGSPIIDLRDGKVVAIAQRVITSQVDIAFKEESIETVAIIGLMYGLHGRVFHDLPRKAKEYYTTGKPITVSFPHPIVTSKKTMIERHSDEELSNNK
jgi:S1-C subfamily serine protease